MFSYKPLLKTLVDKNMDLGELQRQTGLSSTIIAKIGKNETMTMRSLDKICNVLNCEIQDVIEHISSISTTST